LSLRFNKTAGTVGVVAKGLKDKGFRIIPEIAI